MNNSSSFFENRDCEFYPCHKGIEQMNCLFCYCPMYTMQNCPGEPVYKEKNGEKIKDCTNCSFPHHAQNYEMIIKFLKEIKE